MSISIVLVPIAIAAVSAWAASRRDTDERGRTICQVQTRMRDDRLLGAALTDTRAKVNVGDGVITADWQGARGEFERDEQGIWQARNIVLAIDQAYGRRVQQAVLTRIRDQASSAGMSIESEHVDDDDNVTLVLNLERET
jgi:co-chaperonin GroES (HSP10)